MSLIDTGQIVVADRPPQIFRFGLSTHDSLARAFVPFIERGFSDREAWESLFSDEENLQHTKAAR